jgi:hypothetical protein
LGDAFESERLGRLAARIGRHFRQKQVIEMQEIPGTRLVVATVGRFQAPTGWEGFLYDRTELVLARIGRNGSVTISDQRRLAENAHIHEGTILGGIDDPSSVDLYLLKLGTGASEFTAVAMRSLPMADSEPLGIDFVPIKAGRFARPIRFGAWGGGGIHPRQRGEGAVVTVTTTFKVWWQDVYEWRNGRFVFANERHPELYSRSDFEWTNKDCDAYYPLWMQRAAKLDVLGDFDKGLATWCRAKVACENYIRYGALPNSEYRDFGYYGDSRVNLGEIRERIRWIVEGDHGHKLLYRPYDFDLQVPPYRLGRAEE